MVDLNNAADNGEPPAFNVPSVVLGLIGVLVVAYAVFAWAQPEQQGQWLFLFALFPARFIASDLHPDLIFPGGFAGDVWTLFTYTLMHGSWTHVIINCVWLLAFGSAVARRIGSFRFLLFFFFCGIVGALLHVVLYGGSLVPVVGASGAISGLMGGAVRFVFLAGGPLGGLGGHRGPSTAPRAQMSIGAALRDRRIMTFVGVWVLLNFIFGVSGVNPSGQVADIAWIAHLGGFLAGLFFFGIFDGHRSSPSGGPGNVGYGEWSGRDKD
ncbi:MAG: rhomboid family intramembrane serine protease [Parvibaculum sp.]|nr:rhomboid family intramembrane serine protease [Parvibaculum sp.]